jgi:hypothetical protein
MLVMSISVGMPSVTDLAESWEVPYLAFWPLKPKCKIPALKYHIFKSQNLHDWGSVSAIDPINPLVYIQASYLASNILTLITVLTPLIN